MIEAAALVSEVLPIAKEAGHRIMAVFNSKDLDIQQKRDWSPVTRADLESNQYITQQLNQLTPDIPVLSEEDPEVPFAQRRQWKYHWLIDPLDGTRSFIDNHRDFSINIALIHQQRAILGVVYAPSTGICYYAEASSGVFKIDEDDVTRPIQTRKMGDKAVVVLGSRSHGSEAIKDFVSRLAQHSMIKMGSALKSCLVAEGKADIYPRFGPTSEWDTAAAQIIVEMAGGFMTDLQMAPLLYNARESIINPYFLCIGDNSYPWQEYLPELTSG